MPSQEELEETLEALINNGLDFIARSAKELDSEQKFAIAHFATGVELLLKARLFYEHWALVAARPHEATWANLKNGDVVTLQANQLVDSIAKLLGAHSLVGKSESLKTLLAPIFSHRNQALHFLPSSKINDIAREQLRAWHHLEHLLLGTWFDVYKSAFLRIGQVDVGLSHHRQYLEARFAELVSQGVYRGLRPEALMECPVCNFCSGILHDPDEDIAEMSCAVCRTDMEVEKIGENEWEAYEYEATDVACSSCSDHSIVVKADRMLKCQSCKAEYVEEDVVECEWCCQAWAGGIDESEGDSYSFGCGECGGSFQCSVEKDD